MSQEWSEWAQHILAELRRFDTQHSSISEKISDLGEKINDQNVILIRNTASLEEHMRRTNILESNLDRVEVEVSDLDGHVRDAIKLRSKVINTENKVVDLQERVSKLYKVVNRFRLTPSKLKYITMVVGLVTAMAAMYYAIVKPEIPKVEIKVGVDSDKP